MATRRQDVESLDEDETWFEDATVKRSGGRVNLWLGLGVVGVAALGFALGAFGHQHPKIRNAAIDEGRKAVDYARNL
ncbi:MAG TPA: hypothetical protein PK095_06520, partial [Myxococcota bacterium]|nr:hypothetical protein [Myxococcota bacterium]